MYYSALIVAAGLLLHGSLAAPPEETVSPTYPPVNTGLLSDGEPADWPRMGEIPIEDYRDSAAIEALLDRQSELTSIREMPELPAVRGWYTHVGVQDIPTFLQFDSGRLSARSHDRFWMFAPASGDLLESGQIERNFTQDHTYGVVENWQNREPGQKQPLPQLGAAWAEVPPHLLDRPDSMPLRLDDRGLWLITGGSVSDYKRPFFHYLELFDGENGNLIEIWNIPLTYLVLGAELPAGSPLVLIGDGVVNLLHDDGTIEEFANIGGGIITAADYDGNRLTLVAAPFTPELEFANVRKDPAFAEGLPLLRQYSVPDSELLWERKAAELLLLPVLNLDVQGDYFMTSTMSGFNVYSTVDGSLLFEQDDNHNYRLARFIECGDAGIYWSGAYSGEQRGMELFRPLDGTHQRIEALEHVIVEDALLSGSRLYVLARTHPTGHDYWSANSHLLCLELGDNGLPLPGELKVVSAPPDYSQLVERFMAQADPGLDSELMGEFIMGGINPFRALLRHIPEMTSVQLDSLALLAAHMSPPPDSQAWIDPFDSMDSLIDWLINNGNETLTDDMLRWYESASLYWMQFTGPGIIAACGGPEAKQWLDDYYGTFLTEPGSQPTGPVSLSPESAYIGDIFQPDGPGSTQWQDIARDDEGTTYLAYVADGLASERDIFIAVDGNGDQLYEEVLPTGLSHTYFYMMHPGGPVRVDPLAAMSEGAAVSSIPLSLELIGDELQIGHYVPGLEQIEYDYSAEGGISGSYTEMTSAEYVIDLVSMVDLRMDSDADGLTDIAESLMQTDPQDPDTDGDSVADGQDRNPLVDVSQLGQDERMASRGLAFYTQYNRGFDWWWHSRLENQPMCARYIESEDGLGALAIAGHPGTWNISLTSPDQLEIYNEKLNGYNSFNRITVSPGEEIRLGGSDLSALTTFGSQFPQGTDRMMHINMALQGQYITFVEIEGEYYPVTVVRSWIS